MTTTNTYTLTRDEVTALKWALLYVKAHAPGSTVELTVDQIIELENKLLWRETASA